ncbi:tRNA 2'-phosphotransferase 1 [Vespa crabro]|uniref:tRNA 2'-phosphotransferase 1 n=1 Tax=Vespa crabro TaxID=7445 RepID=UPI001EFF8555|nr:tRNA 2'-phosphotransferase 1 [Vespa crabro]
MMAHNKDYIRLSKKLSYLLRHGAIREGLSIRTDGFSPIDQLLSEKLQGYTLEDIKKVVETNDKKRFILRENNGNWEIKATQGHSINNINNLSLKQLDHVDFDIIHGTYYRNWESIKLKGLSRMRRNHIHFSKGLNFICGLRKSAEIYICIDFEKAKREGLKFFESENEIILCAGNDEGIIERKYFLKVYSKNSEILDLD